ncbi:EDC3 [Candida pseudojiufengensis]|uniref:EDC3 n=1 Tax=Candida pseudojiufengensis TaxID=497109 RepID=UPI002224E4C9|nr:EDC3 [Candida pseudojiufengensis]KAI5965974.1 EDC3 [Candida pseudojiufengensis]
MSEFTNYKVRLTLKDKSTLLGLISHVDDKQITLSNAINSIDPKNVNTLIKIPNSQVTDLRVIQLPTTTNKKNKKQARNEEILNESTNHTPSRSNTPKLTNQNHNEKNKTWESNSDIEDVKNQEFDFQANLAMFDKKSVFEDFKRKDNIQLNDRLVGHNKIENIKKKEKYDVDEMVLHPTTTKDNWDQIGKSLDRSRTETPKSDSHRNQTPSKPSEVKKNYKLVNSIDSTPLFSASPVQLLEIERFSMDLFGITPAIMSEVCATNLSRLIIDTCLGGSVRLSNKQNHNLPPLVLLLIGSARCGTRAFATGRHLSNHGVRVLAFVVSSDESDPELTQQWRSFESTGGKVITESFEELDDIIRNQLNTPVELIIDALQGYDDHLEDIFYKPEDQQTLSTLIDWCNKPQQQPKIMSLDIPSGIDAGSGLPENKLKINCHWCISMGLPLNGIILAYKNGYMDEDIIHYLIDVGIPNKVFQTKPNLRKFDRYWYIAESSIKISIQHI